MLQEVLSHENIVAGTGILAGVLTAVSMMPQVIKTIKTKEAENVSPVMLSVLICGIDLWIAYGCFKKDLPIIFTNGISLVIIFSCYICSLSIMNIIKSNFILYSNSFFN